ncbi:MAG: TIGR00282 family metallophosphoesterase [Oscillospiraceae bacterium]
MKVLFIGDIVGSSGCDHLRQVLPQFKREKDIDIIIANGENSAEGNGMLPHSIKHILDSGVDVVTSGNHALRRREIFETLDSDLPLIRPANLHYSAPGRGYYIIDKMKYRLCVINLQGTVYMDSYQNPFERVDQILEDVDTPNIIVDFHAEATAEKIAFGKYLDGRVSAVVGTHTHVQTNDARIFEKGTGYITDVGMCGGANSVLGVRAEISIQKFRTNLPVRFENDKNNIVLNGVYLEIDEKTGKTTKIETVNI